MGKGELGVLAAAMLSLAALPGHAAVPAAGQAEDVSSPTTVIGSGDPAGSASADCDPITPTAVAAGSVSNPKKSDEFAAKILSS